MLRASLLPNTNPASSSPDESAPPPPLPELEERYGTLFGEMVQELWDRGGKEIWETVQGSATKGGMNQELSQGAQAKEKQEDMVQDEDEDVEEDAEGEGEGEGETETREGSAMEE